MVSILRENFEGGVLSTIEQRLNQLQQIDLLIQENKEALEEVVYKDLRKVCSLYTKRFMKFSDTYNFKLFPEKFVFSLMLKPNCNFHLFLLESV